MKKSFITSGPGKTRKSDFFPFVNVMISGIIKHQVQNDIYYLVH